MKKVLIFGGSYFIGKHVVDALKQDFDVTVLNRGSRPFNDSNVKELIADRNSETAMKEVLKGKKFDALVDISTYKKHQLQIALDALDLKALKHYVFISTSAVYDVSEKVPFKEGDGIGGDNPFGDYAREKIACEALLKETLAHTELTIFRPPYVYGESNYLWRERLAFKRILEGNPIYLPDAPFKLQFVYVKDLASYILETLTRKIPAGVYNIGSTDYISYKEWAHLCMDVVGKDAKLKFVPLNSKLKARSYFPFALEDILLDVSKIKQYTHTFTPLKVGFKAAYDDYLDKQSSLEFPSHYTETFTQLDEDKKK